MNIIFFVHSHHISRTTVYPMLYPHGIRSCPATHSDASRCCTPKVSGLLQRLTVAEMSIAEEQSKREILMRWEPLKQMPQFG